MGIVFALLTAATWAAYNIAVRRGLEQMGSGAGYLLTLFVGVVLNPAMLLLPLPGRGAGLVAQAAGASGSVAQAAGASGLLAQAAGAGSWSAPQVLAVLWFICAGFSTTLLGRWAYFRSVDAIGPSRASAWKNASPVYTLILAAVFLRERFGLWDAVGTLAATLGLLLLSREQSGAGRASRANVRTAIMLGIASGFGFSGGMLFRKAGLNIWPDAAAGTAIGAVAALGAYLPFALVKGEMRALLRGPHRGAWLFVAAGVFSSMAQLSTFLSLRVTATATTHVIASLEPMFTMLLSVLLLRRQERLTTALFGSATLVCLGVVLIASL